MLGDSGNTKPTLGLKSNVSSSRSRDPEGSCPTDVYYNTSGMGVPWLTCTEFKVSKKALSEEPHNGAVLAIEGAFDPRP